MALHNRINNEELKQRLWQSSEPRTTLSFYQYWNIQDPGNFRDDLYRRWFALRVFGRIYVAKEGVNGQISVPTDNLNDFKDDLYSIPAMKGIRLNIAIDDDGRSFYKLKIKVREKIVADGLNDATFDATKRGRRLSAQEVNDFISRRDTIVVDMRNHYESEVGYFEKAIRPDVETFREALPLVEKILDEEKDKSILMYCTGGIRCEKASAYFLHRGFKDVSVVEGGIIEYARQCRQKGLENKFLGKNFVFDERMGERVGDQIVSKCHQCGEPCDHHINCANDACHLLFIQCEACAEKYRHCCSEQCFEFIQLPAGEQQARRKNEVFRGTKFGKGRFEQEGS